VVHHAHPSTTRDLWPENDCIRKLNRDRNDEPDPDLLALPSRENSARLACGQIRTRLCECDTANTK